MTAGFQAFAQDGSNMIQVDTEEGLPNWQLLQKVTITPVRGVMLAYQNIQGQTYSSPGWVVDFAFTAQRPMLVFETAGNACPYRWDQNGNSFTVHFICNDANPLVIYIYDKTSSIPLGNNFGAQAFNAAGEIIADMTTPFLKPLGGPVVGNPKYAVGSTGYAVDSGTWALDQGTYGFSVQQKVGICCVAPAYAVGGQHGGVSNGGTFMSLFGTRGNGVNVIMQSIGDNSSYNNYTGFREALTWGFIPVDISFL